MAGQLSGYFTPSAAHATIFAVLASVAVLMSSASAQSATDPSPPSGPVPPPSAATPPATPGNLPKAAKLGKGVESPAFDNVRKALDALTPEQRKRFQENFLRWANLSPEEKKLLRDREEVRKKIVAQEIDFAIKETGLELDPERRELFAKRYGEERRKIEEQLRKESAEKRKPMVKEMVARLKQEFATPAQLPATAQPSQ
jgi:hypothetical protein